MTKQAGMRTCCKTAAGEAKDRNTSTRFYLKPSGRMRQINAVMTELRTTSAAVQVAVTVAAVQIAVTVSSSHHKQTQHRSRSPH